MDINRIKKIKESLPVKFFFDKSFEKNGFPSKILAEIKLAQSKLEYNNILNCSVLLNKEQEYHFFRKYNYLKYRVLKVTVGFPASKEKPWPKPCPSVKLERLGENSLNKIEQLLNKIEDVRNLLLTSNMRLIVKQVSRHAPEDGFRRDEFISNAYMHVLKSIDCFDFRRGFKFSTYCINVLKSNLSRDNAVEFKKQSVIENSEEIKNFSADEVNFSEANIIYNKKMIELIFEEIRKNSTRPEDRIAILKSYYGIEGQDRLLLRDLAEKLNISKERVRQIKLQTIESVKHLKYDPLI